MELVTKINIGCGKTLLKGYLNLDTHLRNGADAVYALPATLPFPKESLDVVACWHVLEDFSPRLQRMIILDCYRVLKKGGVLHLKVPHVSNKCFVGSLYHFKPWVSGTVNALVKGFVEDNYDEPVRFEKYVVKRVNFHKTPLIWFCYGWWNELLVNSSSWLRSLYEFSCWSNLFPAHEVEVALRK